MLVLHGLQGDSIDFRRAALMFSGLRIARANLKQLGFERGDLDVGPAAPSRSKKDPDDLPGPSLAEFLLKRLDDIEAEDAAAEGRPAPPPSPIEEAHSLGCLNELLIKRLDIVPDPPPSQMPGDCAVPAGLGTTADDDPGTHVPG